MVILVIIAGALGSFSIIGVGLYWTFRVANGGTSKLENTIDSVQGKKISLNSWFADNWLANLYFDGEYVYVVQSGSKARLL